MKVIQSTHHVPYFAYKNLDQYFGDMKIGIFDIETTGLNPQFAQVILTGFMVVEPDGSCTITQYFAENPNDEKEILLRLKDDFEQVNYLLTYNGKHFDLPFVQKRASKLDIDGPDCNIYNLDLYLILNGHSEIRYIIKSLKQKNVEAYMGLCTDRSDTISGAESVELYMSYLRESNPARKAALEKTILLHNHDDIIQLYRILPIIKQVDLHKAFNRLGFAAEGQNGWPDLNITSIESSITGLSVSGRYRGESFSYISYDTFEDNFSCEFSEDNSFKFRIRTDRHKGNTFANLKRFFEDYSDFAVYPNYMNGFLFLSGGNQTNYLEMNMFVLKFLSKFMNDRICPRMVL